MRIKKLWNNTAEKYKRELNERELAEAYCTLNFKGYLEVLSNEGDLEALEGHRADLETMGVDDIDKVVFVEEKIKEVK